MRIKNSHFGAIPPIKGLKSEFDEFCRRAHTSKIRIEIFFGGLINYWQVSHAAVICHFTLLVSSVTLEDPRRIERRRE
jgi:hypothetical protein